MSDVMSPTSLSFIFQIFNVIYKPLIKNTET